ncbi:hypothetical protein BKA63DRAFT_579368 [Paraphoma chrysanthemicola]|nr:hypothetical protein BKA63DRAFT_579368 [Paraphoma chrysanthemicola]
MCYLLPQYLAQKIQTPLDIRTEFLDRINMMHGFVCELMECASAQARDTLLDKLCQGIVAMTGAERIMTLLWDSRERLDNQFVRALRGGFWAKRVTCLQPQDKVVAAMAIGAHAVLPKLLSHLDDREFKYRSHSPLVAVLLEDETILHTVLDLLATFGPFGDYSWKDFGVLRFIELAIFRSTWDLVLLVLNRLRASGARTHVCKKVVVLNNMEIFNLLLPAVNLNYGAIDSLLLHIALRGRNFDMVGSLIDAGAHVHISVKEGDDFHMQRKTKTKGKKNKKKTMKSHSELQHRIDVVMNIGAAQVELLLERGAALPHSRSGTWRTARCQQHDLMFATPPSLPSVSFTCSLGIAERQYIASTAAHVEIPSSFTLSIIQLANPNSILDPQLITQPIRRVLNMDLLDLPPEVFEDVIHELVSTAGVDEAWRLRGVCRVFSSAITFDILAKQPRQAFATKPFSVTKGVIYGKLMTKTFGTYLYYRTRNYRDVHPEIPERIHQMVAYLRGLKNVDLPDQEDLIFQELCNNIDKSAVRRHIIQAMWMGSAHLRTAKSRAGLTSLERLASAILIGSVSQVDALLASDNMLSAARIMSKQCVFGHSLQVALSLDHLAIVASLLKHIERCTMTKRLRNSVLVMLRQPERLEAFTSAIVNNEHRVVKNITAWYSKYTEGKLRMPKPRYAAFLNEAIRSHSSVETIKYLLSIPFAGQKIDTPRVMFTQLSMACVYKRPDIVDMFIKEGHIAPNDNRTKTRPLIVAVRSGNARIVQNLLNAGASPDTPYGKGDRRQSALEIAAQKKMPDVVACLLVAGARTPDIEKWPAHGETYKLLRQAKMDREKVVIPEFKEASPAKGVTN